MASMGSPARLSTLLNALRIIAVDGFGELCVHCVHQRSIAKGPGSFVEVTKVLTLLTAISTDRPLFHVVTPSLPGSSSQQVHDLARLPRIHDPRWDWGHIASKYGPRHVKGVSLTHAHERFPNGMSAHVHRLSVKRCDLPCFRENPITPLRPPSRRRS
ncbi:hypothetical protein EDB89DRAFT_1981202, partial [Lactarius sanguifluus]